MAKSNLLKIIAITATISLVGCASKSATDTGDGATSTETAATEVVAEAEPVVVEVASEAPAVTTAAANTGATISVIPQFKAPAQPVYSEPAIMRPLVNVVYFDFDKAAINPEFRALLDQHGDFLATNPDVKAIIAGHADERGTREYNLALGERRAYAVYAYLKLRGVSPDQLEMVSYGEEMPVSVGKSESDYAKNRRVEFNYQ